MLFLAACFITFLIWLVLSKIVCKVKSLKHLECSDTAERVIKRCSFFAAQTIMTVTIIFVTVFNHADYFGEDYIEKEFMDGNNHVKLNCYFVNQTTNRFSSNKVTTRFSVNAYKNGIAYHNHIHESFFIEDGVYVGKDNVIFTEESDGIRIMIVVNETTIKEIKLYYDDMEDGKNAA